MSQLAYLLPWIAAVVIACGPTVDEVNRERGARIEQVLRRAKAVGAAVARAPYPARPEPGTLHASLPLTQPARSGNAAFIYAEDFEDFDELGLVYARLPGGSLVSRCAAAAHTERRPWDPASPATQPRAVFGNEAAQLYDACERLHYLFVIRTDTFLRPGAPRPASTADTERRRYDFDGGLVAGELLVYSLASAELLGATRFQATSRESFPMLPSEAELESDLVGGVAAALKEAAEKNLRGVTVIP
ncbi:MAG: hypothetical protein OZ921_17980 [Sorangiineae bacterium]|nr:hypothetical protein [Polyangiaceae bacterium]MEB2324408.1 hypothetical protein [Sorangiineae bacterium]